jgi:hypothetical protein
MRTPHAYTRALAHFHAYSIGSRPAETREPEAADRRLVRHGKSGGFPNTPLSTVPAAGVATIRHRDGGLLGCAGHLPGLTCNASGRRISSGIEPARQLASTREDRLDGPSGLS